MIIIDPARRWLTNEGNKRWARVPSHDIHTAHLSLSHYASAARPRGGRSPDGGDAKGTGAALRYAVYTEGKRVKHERGGPPYPSFLPPVPSSHLRDGTNESNEWVEGRRWEGIGYEMRSRKRWVKWPIPSPTPSARSRSPHEWRYDMSEVGPGSRGEQREHRKGPRNHRRNGSDRGGGEAAHASFTSSFVSLLSTRGVSRLSPLPSFPLREW